MEKFTWYDLKTFCNSLPPEQLGKEVIVWGDEEGFKITGKQILEDDFINPSGEGCEPISFYKENLEDWEEVKDEPIVAHKGEPRLLTD